MKKRLFVLIFFFIYSISLCVAVYLVSIKYLTKQNEDIMYQSIKKTGGGKLTIMKPIINPVDTPRYWQIQGKLDVGSTDDIRGLGYTGQRKVVQDSYGGLYVAYRNKYEGNQEIFVPSVRKQTEEDKFTVSGNSKPIYSFGDDAVQRVPSIAVDRKGNVHVVWYGLSDSDSGLDAGRQIYYSFSSDRGKSWSSAKNISKVDGYDDEDYWQEHPYILVGENSTLFVVWEGKDRSHEEQQAKFVVSLDGGKSWGSWKNVQTTPDNTQSRPTMIIDDAGVLHLFAYSSKGAKVQQIVHSTSTNNGDTWSPWKVISSQGEDSRHASVVYANQNVYVAWRAFNGSKSAIKYSILVKGIWSSPKIAVESSQNQFFPSIGANVSGDIALTWMEASDKYDLPKDDPEQGLSFIAILNKETSTFDVGFKLDSSELIYPSLPANSYTDDFYVTALNPQSDSKRVFLYILTH